MIFKTDMPDVTSPTGTTRATTTSAAPGDNFTNILRAAFAIGDSQKLKKTLMT